MRILFVSGDAHLPQMSGGVQSSTDELVRKFRSAGHDASVFCALHGGGLLEWTSRIRMKLFASRIARDRGLGYPVCRAWAPWEEVDSAIELAKPDVVLIQHMKTVAFLKAFERWSIPSVVYLRNVEFEEIGGDLGSFRRAVFIANSTFTAKRYHERYGIDCHVCPPTINPVRYRVQPAGDRVVFVNPTSVKGVDLAIEIARRCPLLPFWFVESWSLNAAARADLVRRIAGLPNVMLKSNTNDMRTIYGSARMVLAPSQWEEAWGRVASEAHVSGIPVIGSNRGGLPEAIGPGGMTLDHDAPVEQWADAVQSVWHDEALHRRLSIAAKGYSERPELDFDHQADQILNILRAAASSCSN